MSEKSNEWEKCESFAIIDWKVFEIQWFLKSLVTNYNIQGVSDQVYSIYVF